MLFFHHTDGSDGVRCIDHGQLTNQHGSEQEQVVNPPVENVYKVCTNHVSASVSYASYEDPTAQSAGLSDDAIGSIDLYLRSDTCETVHNAVGEDTMVVTGILFNPCYCGIGGEPSTKQLIHQVEAAECARRSDFFTVWYAGGKQKVCYANAGFLRLDTPLMEVVKVCGGANTGSVSLDQGTVLNLSSISLFLGKLQTCVSSPALIRERSLSINAISIEPVRS